MNNFFEVIIKCIKNNYKEVYKFEEYCVYIDKQNNRYIEAKDNSFHLLFNKKTGQTYKWGKTYEDNPDYCPFGNEIADIEITKACRGIRVFDKNSNQFKRTPCPWCYKSNSASGTYMNFETFKKVFDVLDKQKTMTQIAFGVDAEASEELNPDIWKIFEYTKSHNVTPNVTIADISKETAQKIVSLCGACAVSAYQTNKNCCYDSIKLITDTAKEKGKEHFACNIHLMVSKETLPFVHEVIEDYHKDKRLKNMNAIVFLSLKQKGRGEHFNKISDEEFKEIVDICLAKGIKFGMDSCSANKFLKAIKDRKDFNVMSSFVESCEKLLYSLFINDKAELFPCSFMEKEGEWKNGIDMTKVNDFVKDVWYCDKVKKDRDVSMKCINCNGCNSCSYYNV